MSSENPCGWISHTIITPMLAGLAVRCSYEGGPHRDHLLLFVPRVQQLTKGDKMREHDYKVSLRLDRVEAQRLQRLTRETATTPREALRCLIRNLTPNQLEQLFQQEQAL